MGVGSPGNPWRFSDINATFEFCPTYPSTLVIPSRISDNVLKHIGKFRSKSRIPSLSYIHSNRVSLTRSAQPMVGLKQVRSIQDEKLVEAIFASSNSPESTALNTVPMNDAKEKELHLIIDARPTANAIAQMALGGGAESAENYKGSKVLYLGIDNIHAVRDSMAKLYDGLEVNRKELDRSGWLKHVRNIIAGTHLIVSGIHCDSSHVLVHCSDGWDRTAQLCSLAQCCLDPYYRTIEGFLVLLEKEWVAFGHKFQDRCGHLSKEKKTQPSGNEPFNANQWESAGRSVSNSLNTAFSFLSGKSTPQTRFGPQSLSMTSKLPVSAENASSEPGMTATSSSAAPREMSPVFPQFLDCLYQIWTQFPTQFEFDEKLLEFLYLSCYSCQFGTFLFNNQKERLDFRFGNRKIEECTVSIWDYILQFKETFINPVYVRTFNAAPSSQLATLQIESEEDQPGPEELDPVSDPLSSIPNAKARKSSKSKILSSMGEIGSPGTISSTGVLFPSVANLVYWPLYFQKSERVSHLSNPSSSLPRLDSLSLQKDPSNSSQKDSNAFKKEKEDSPPKVDRVDSSQKMDRVDSSQKVDPYDVSIPTSRVKRPSAQLPTPVFTETQSLPRPKPKRNTSQLELETVVLDDFS